MNVLLVVKNVFERGKYWHNRSPCRRLTGKSISGPLILPFFPSSISFFSVTTFFQRTAACIKELILQQLMGAPKNVWLHPFQTPSDFFGPPGGHFGFFRLFSVAAFIECPLHHQVGIFGDKDIVVMFFSEEIFLGNKNVVG